MTTSNWIEQPTDTLEVVQMLLSRLNDKGEMRPITSKTLHRAKMLLGLRLQPVWQVGNGLLNWEAPFDLRVRLEQAGLDPTTGELRDLAKFEATLKRLDAQEQARKQQKRTARMTLEEMLPEKSATPCHPWKSKNGANGDSSDFLS